MKILIIGNGFDLAHGLPTKYTDFLDSSRKFLEYHEDNIKHSTFGEFFAKALKKHDLYDEFCSFKGNVWLDYLLKRKSENEAIGDTWIDFEREVRKVIEELESCLDKGELWKITNYQLKYDFFTVKFIKELPTSPLTGNKHVIAISEFLFKELMGFTRAFEIYCLCIVNQHINDYVDKNIRELLIDIKEHDMRISRLWYPLIDSERTYNNDLVWHFRHQIPTAEMIEQKAEEDPNFAIIKNSFDTARNNYDDEVETKDILEMEKEAVSLLSSNNDFGFALSFNYTNTFEALYGGYCPTEFCYIHGEAQSQKDKTNMIFGINETLEGDNIKKQFIFAKFKKYFQRIVNETGSDYKDWIRDYANKGGQLDIYIIGHSMDSTDHEILKEFFDIGRTNTQAKVTVFYHDEMSKINLIQNTIEMIGKDELISRVHGSDRNISFINQYDKDMGIIKRISEMENPPCEGLCGVYQNFACSSCKKNLT